MVCLNYRSTLYATSQCFISELLTEQLSEWAVKAMTGLVLIARFMLGLCSTNLSCLVKNSVAPSVTNVSGAPTSAKCRFVFSNTSSRVFSGFFSSQLLTSDSCLIPCCGLFDPAVPVPCWISVGSPDLVSVWQQVFSPTPVSHCLQVFSFLRSLFEVFCFNTNILTNFCGATAFQKRWFDNTVQRTKEDFSPLSL